MVGAGIEGRLSSLFPRLDRENLSPLDLRDLDCGEPDPARPSYVRTVRGVGYRLCDPAEPTA